MWPWLWAPKSASRSFDTEGELNYGKNRLSKSAGSLYQGSVSGHHFRAHCAGMGRSLPSGGQHVQLRNVQSYSGCFRTREGAADRQIILLDSDGSTLMLLPALTTL